MTAEKQHKSGSRRFYNRVVKRLFDMVISALALIVLSPVMLVSAILIRLTSPGPAIFRQTRIGRGAKEYTIYKFRTMRVNSEHTGSGVYSDDSDPRMTGIGKILRKTSIDELPQLVNILKGDMSLIGPRPPLTYHPWPIEGTPRSSFACSRCAPASPAGHRSTGARTWSGISASG